MNNLVSPDVQLINSKLMVSSLNIAEVFKKRHKNVLRKIEFEISKGQLTERNFIYSVYTDKKNSERPMYFLDERFTKKLVGSFTGDNSDEYIHLYFEEFTRIHEINNNSFRKSKLELEEQNKTLEVENKKLKANINLAGIQYTALLLEQNGVKKRRKKQNLIKESCSDIDIFGNPILSNYDISKDKKN